MGRQCAVIRLRAERRLGELLRQLVKRGKPKMSPQATFKLRKLGITQPVEQVADDGGLPRK